MGLLVFLLALPLSVYLLGTILAVLDGGDGALRRLASGFGLAALFVVLTPAEIRFWIGVAFLLVLGAHLATALTIRYVIRSGRWPARHSD